MTARYDIVLSKLVGIRIPAGNMWSAVVAAVAIGILPINSANAEDFWVALEGSDCKIWSDEPPNSNDEVTWSGTCKDGRASGAGKLEWKRSGKLLGTYDGNMTDGRFNGPGRLRLTTKSGGYEQMEGYYNNGVIGEIGLYQDSAGNIYDGELKNGKPHGTGYAKGGGEEYAGEFRDGKRNGIGVLITADAAYVGEFENGKANGSGMLEDTEGGRLHGQFKDGHPDGAGTYVTKDGAVYQGQFKTGNADGEFLVKKSVDAKPVIETWKDGKRVK